MKATTIIRGGPEAKVLRLYFLSGASALIYEVCFVKSFAVTFGSNSQALSTVLAAFMGGLALGSLIGGKISDRVSNPLRWFGAAEGLIGLVGLALPLILLLLKDNFIDVLRLFLPDGPVSEARS